nr:MAG TPA: hypothetical protein [Caudoviricetes sp.]
MANEIHELNYDEILTLIHGQLLEYMNAPGNYERFKDYKIIMSREQQFMKMKDKDPNAIYIVIKFGSADVVFGQTVLPVTIVALSEQDNIEAITGLLYEYAQTYNLKRVNDDTINQMYESPSVSSNFAPLYAGYRSTVVMSAAFVIGKNSNEYKVYYYYTVQEKVDDKTYREVEYADEVPQMSASFAFVANPDTQAFYNSNDFTRSVIGFGGVTLGFTTFVLSDNRLINDVLDILGTVEPIDEGSKTYILGDYTTKVQIEKATDTANNLIEQKLVALGYITNTQAGWDNIIAQIKAGTYTGTLTLAQAKQDKAQDKEKMKNMSVIETSTDKLWRYVDSAWVEKETIEPVANSSNYIADNASTVNKTFKLGTIYRDGKHARIKNYKLANATGSQEIGQIPVISLAFVE